MTIVLVFLIGVKGGGGGKGSSGIVIHSDGTFCSAVSDFTLRKLLGRSPFILSCALVLVGFTVIFGFGLGVFALELLAVFLIRETDEDKPRALALTLDLGGCTSGGGIGEEGGLIKITSSSWAAGAGGGVGFAGVGGNRIFLIPEMTIMICYLRNSLY